MLKVDLGSLSMVVCLPCCQYYKLFQISKERAMGSSFSFSCRRPVVLFEPEHYCRRLGQECEVCACNLSHQKCISVCQCYLFCHQLCFISQLEPILSEDNVDIKCKSCQEMLKIDLESEYRYAPHKTNSKMIQLLLCLMLLMLVVASMVITANMSLRPDFAFILLYVEGLLLGLALYLLAMRVKDILYKRTVRVKQLMSTKLSIQTSAFKEIEISTNEQITKDYMIFQSKKEEKV